MDHRVQRLRCRALLAASLFAVTACSSGEAQVGKPTSVANGNGSESSTTTGVSRGEAERLHVTADLDGDSRLDEITLRGEGDDPNQEHWSIEATLSSGPTATTTLLAHRMAVWIVDVDDDGRNELLLRTGGETWTTGRLLVLDGGQLHAAVRSDVDHDEFGWGAHSNCCASGTADVACGESAGRSRRLVVTSSQLVDPGWNGKFPITNVDPVRAHDADPARRAWDRTVYRLEGTLLVAESTEHGVLVEGERPAPPDLPLRNELHCDDALD